MALTQLWRINKGYLETTNVNFPQNKWEPVYCPMCSIGYGLTVDKDGWTRGAKFKRKQCGVWCPMFEVTVENNGTIYAALHCAFDATYIINEVIDE